MVVLVRETSKWYIPVRTNIENSYGSTYWYVLVCTALYLHSTRWYKMVQDGTRWYKQWYMEVHGGTRPYENYRLVRTGMYLSLRFQVNLGMLPCCWIRCCNSARPIALYWRLQHLITLMQAQECFNQLLLALPPIRLPPLPLLVGGRRQRRFFGGRRAHLES